MSLSEAMLELADEMEKEADRGSFHAGDDWIISAIRGWAKQIRRMCKAAGNETTNAHTALAEAKYNLARQQDAELAQRALDRLQKRKRDALDQIEREFLDKDLPEDDLFVGQLRICADGPEQGTSIPCPPDLQIGKSVTMGNVVYELRNDGKLYHKAPP